MLLAFWLQHRLSWQDGLNIWGDIGRLNLFLMETMTRLGIEFTKPVQPITVAPPAVMAPSLRSTAGHGFEKSWTADTPFQLGAMPGIAPPAQQPQQERHGSNPFAHHGSQQHSPRYDRHGSRGRSGTPPPLSPKADATPTDWVPLPYDEGLHQPDPDRETAVQRFDAKRFGTDFVDIRAGPVASTWTWRLSYADRARQALRKRYAEAGRKAATSGGPLKEAIA